MNSKKLYVVAAGSGGHILPALTIAKRWLETNPSGKVIFWGASGALDCKIIAKTDFLSENVSLKIGKFSLKRILLLPILIIEIFWAFFKSFLRAVKDRPEKIISTGGLISMPVCLGCKLAFVPVEIYELNLEPGKAVKLLMPIANKIFVAFKNTVSLCNFMGLSFAKKCELTHYPIRFTRDVFEITKQQIIDRINEKTDKPFSLQRKTIFLLGGSQGSKMLNYALKKFLEHNKNIHGQIQVIHQIGNDVSFDWRNFYKEMSEPAVLFSYDENIQNFYLLSDLVICRAGAGTLFELEFFQKRSIVVPLVADSTGHQVKNAQAMASEYPELFKLVYQDELVSNPEKFEKLILTMLFE
ncbi:MAG: UDP-N-acetylglucosamine--N-acetylmuramyl-(pentapeptide) pyrophosphoryl-undecaprenol N-acetylglucosamine transferase [Candidatus Babeliales bacterium]|jgi:UDP-N-acetylglucosamine--N-acetylmuramyl-(pentapeptide) pyrophosphoryl-undecaprenol N-acetylglucosamine transferase